MKNDLISRQAAIDALFELYEYQRDIDPTEAADLVRQGIFLAEKKIEKLPSAQPQPCEDDPRADVYYLAEKIGIHRLYALVVELRGEPEPCDSHENDKVFVDKDAYEQCRFEYINACKITHNRTPDTRQSDINDAYAVIKALQPIFGEESF